MSSSIPPSSVNAVSYPDAGSNSNSQSSTTLATPSTSMEATYTQNPLTTSGGSEQQGRHSFTTVAQTPSLPNTSSPHGTAGTAQSTSSNDDDAPSHPIMSTASDSAIPDSTRSSISPAHITATASRTAQHSSKKWIVAVAVLAISVALLLFFTAIWWLRKRNLSSLSGSRSFGGSQTTFKYETHLAQLLTDDDWTLRESVVTHVGSNDTHTNVKSPSIMCAGERESTFLPLFTVSHAPICIDPSDVPSGVACQQAYDNPLGSLVIPQDRALSSLSQISDSSAWDVHGSATAAVLSGNRFSSPVPPSPTHSHTAPSSDTLLWPQRASVALPQGPSDDSAPIEGPVRQRAAHNPFRDANRTRSVVLEEPRIQIGTAPPIPSARQNPFRHPSRAQSRTRELPLSLQPGSGLLSAALSGLHHVEMAQPSPRQWDTGAMSPWMAAQAEITRSRHLEVPQTSWSTDSPTQAAMISTWPAMPPEAMHRSRPYDCMTPSPEPECGAIFYNAI